MKVELELWHLVLLLIAFFGAIGGFGKVLLEQFEKRVAEKFKAAADIRAGRDEALRETLLQHLAQERETGAKISDLEKDFLRWQSELPEKYVRRDDYIRGQTVIEAKLDALYSKLELVHFKGVEHVR